MNRYFICRLLIILFLPLVGKAQYVSEIIEYQPAPGQLINTTAFGSPQAAESIIGNINGLVSLGAFGGTITVKMEEPIENDPLNPFGVDFTIFGNAMQDWCEAAAIQVMKDENQNGLADDSWYLIAGSDYYFESAQNHFQIEYFKPEEDLDDILWIDQYQDSGYVFANSIHQHSYYPSSDFFPEINQQSQVYSAFKINGWIDQSNPGYIRSYHRGFGYADNNLRGSSPYEIPDNPYTEELENSGGDAIDISWARDENGQQVFLDEIHFIKITTAINNHAGQLGEISTEISGVIDVSPNSQVSGETKSIVIQDIPHRLLINSNTTLNAIVFDMGIPIDNQNIEWSSSSENTAFISNNQIISDQIGEFILTATSLDFPDISKSIELSVIQPQEIEIDNNLPYLQLEEEAVINTTITDNLGFELANMDVLFEASNENIEIIHNNGESYIKAIEEGESWLKVRIADFPEVQDSMLFYISDESQILKAFVSIKTEDKTLMPRQSVKLNLSNLEEFVTTGENQFHSSEINPENLAQLIISSFQKMNLEEEFQFKNDLDNEELYLWKVPVESESSIDYIYGYGGRTETPFERSWIVKLNEQNIVRDFQNIPIQNHDEVTIYHINNVNESWTLNEFTSLNDSVSQNESINVQLEEYEMEMYSNAQVYTLSQNSIPNIALYNNDSELWHNDIQVFTNTVGSAEFQLNELGDHILSANGEEIKIHVHQATGIEELNSSSLNIYPNPVSGNHLNIDSDDEQIDEITIFNLSGQILKSIQSHTLQIPISNLLSGTYILQIRTKKSIYNQRFIKR